MNQTDLEERLRAAYRARADLVTADALTHEAPSTERPGRRVRRGLVAPLLAAAAVVLLAVAAAVIAHFVDKGTPPATPRLRFTTPDVKPWNGVAPGWTIATWSRKPDSSTFTIYLVAPNGTRHAVSVVHGTSTTAVGDISQDFSHVAFVDVTNAALSRHITIVDLRNGTTTHLTVPPGEIFGSFAAPDGSTVRLAVAKFGLGNQFKIVDLHGVVLSTGPTSAFDRLLAQMPGNSTRVTIDGHAGYVNRGPSSITVGTATGQVLTELPLPGRGCGDARPWDETSLLVGCDSGMWQVPLDGSRAVLLAKPTANVSVGWSQSELDRPYRLWDIGRVDGQLYGYEFPHCGGSDVFVRIGADQAPQPITSKEVNRLAVAGAFTGFGGGAFHYIAVAAGCNPKIAGTLYSFDPSTNKATPLLGGRTAGGGFVRSAITVPSPGPWGRNWLPGG